jgi:hypothetical protein
LGALHLGLFEQPVKSDFFSKRLKSSLDGGKEINGGKEILTKRP